MPTVSINISCYNRYKELEKCLESFVNQDYVDFEIILVDDGSDYENIQTLGGMDDRIKYFYQEHGGMAKGLNLALTKSTGKYIMPIGSDDLALPDLLQKEVDVLENNSQYDVVFCDYWLRKNGKMKRKKFGGINLGNQEKFYEEMLERQTIAHGATLWRKEKYLPLEENLSKAEDWELFLSSIERGLKFYHIPERLWIYNVDGKDRDSITKEMVVGCQKVMEKRGRVFNNKTRRGEKI